MSTKTPATPRLKVISLGGGTQSTVLALRAAEYGGVDCAIFADTGWEPKQVYELLDWLDAELPFPIYRVKREGASLLEATEAGELPGGHPGLAPPVFIKGEQKTGMIQRQCTWNYKLIPIQHKIRELLNVGPRSYIPPGTVENWLGLSTDEVARCKPSRVQYIVNRWPLIEASLRRNDTISWFTKRYPGVTLPRSACVGCPYRSAKEWVQVRKADKEMWERTVRLDAALRYKDEAHAYLHRRCVPLSEAVDIDEAMLASRPLLFDSDDGWDNECGGHCGV